MSLTNQIKNQHLLWRAGFGPAVEQLDDLSKFSTKQFYKSIVKASEKKPEPIDEAEGNDAGFDNGHFRFGKNTTK